MNLQEVAEWVAGIYQLEIEDLLQGGADGVDNLQAKQLANRTLWLKQKVESAFQRDGTDVLGAQTDWDDYRVSGFFFGTAMMNAPAESSDGHFVLVLSHGGNAFQMAFPQTYEGAWIRIFRDEAWEEWERLGQSSGIVSVSAETYAIELSEESGRFVSIHPTQKTTFQLPVIEDGGMTFTFVRANQAGLRIKAPEGVSINGSQPGGHMEAVTADENHASVTVLAISDSQWITTGGLNTWHESRSGGVDVIRVFGIVTNSAETIPAGGDFSASVNLI